MVIYFSLDSTLLLPSFAFSKSQRISRILNPANQKTATFCHKVDKFSVLRFLLRMDAIASSFADLLKFTKRKNNNSYITVVKEKGILKIPRGRQGMLNI